MSAAARYLLTLVCGAMVCALTESIAGNGPGSGVRKLICGLFMAFLVISPLKTLDLPDLDLQSYSRDAEAAAEAGQEQAEQARLDIISGSAEAYIWNKAAGMGLDLEISVELDGDGIPCAVTLAGSVTPYEKASLSDMIAGDLGIGKEAQTWTTAHQSSD